MLREYLKFLINVPSYLISIYISFLKFSFYLSNRDSKRKEMKPTSSKRTTRIERKKKKMAALLEIAKLNEHDRALKSKKNLDTPPAEAEPNPKRIRTDEIIVEETEQNANDNVDVKTSEEELQKVEIGPSGKPKLYGEDYLKLKKLLREHTNKMRASPSFRLREIGENAQLSVDYENRIPLFLSDIQHLLMYSQVGVHAPYNPARWCALEKYNRIPSTTVLVVDNISVYYYLAHESMFPFISSTFDIKVEFLTPHAYRSDFVKDISMIPLTCTQMRKYVKQYGDLDTAVVNSIDLFDRIRNLFPMTKTKTENIDYANLPECDSFPRTQLLLSGWQMVEENFPLPIKGLMDTKYAGYVLTKDSYEEVTPFSPFFGLDCEMCRTTCGDLELTRISIVDEDMKVFYEQLVKPDNKITDYLTQYSGITPRMMRNVTKRLQDVQEDLRRILPPDAILVGQSLSNDMHAIRMMHPYIIDTSIIFNITGDRGRKTKLQTLSREFLSESIQEGRGGHCSIEDSLACMKLLKLKLTKNLYFGDAVMGDVQENSRRYPDLGNPNYATSMLKQITKLDKNVRIVGLEDIVARYNFYTFKTVENKDDYKKIQCISEKSNKAVVEKACEDALKHTLNLAHIRVSTNQLEKEDIKTFKNIDKWAKQMYDVTPNPGLCFVIFAGKDQGNGCCFIKLKKHV